VIAIQVLKIVLAALTVLVGLYLLDRVALWAERKGWIFYRKIKPTGNSLGSTALELQKIFESGKPTHVIEAKHDQPKESPDPGSGHA
jgi:hypothetical protein